MQKLFIKILIILQCICLYCVLRLYHLLRVGVSWKGAAPIELWLLPAGQAPRPGQPTPPCESTLLLGYAESDTDASLHEVWLVA